MTILVSKQPVRKTARFISNQAQLWAGCLFQVERWLLNLAQRCYKIEDDYKE